MLPQNSATGNHECAPQTIRINGLHYDSLRWRDARAWVVFDAAGGVMNERKSPNGASGRGSLSYLLEACTILVVLQDFCGRCESGVGRGLESVRLWEGAIAGRLFVQPAVGRLDRGVNLAVTLVRPAAHLVRVAQPPHLGVLRWVTYASCSPPAGPVTQRVSALPVKSVTPMQRRHHGCGNALIRMAGSDAKSSACPQV